MAIGSSSPIHKLAWVTSWNRKCGIATYSQGLWPAVQKELQLADIESILVPLEELARLEDIKPDLIHWQHEYGLFGGKNPPFYRFPNLLRALRKKLPGTKHVATAHNVVSEDYRFSLQHPKWQLPLKFVANAFLLPWLRSYWGLKTWGGFNSVIVHSSLQKKAVQAAGCSNICVIPHYVPAVPKKEPIRVSSDRAPVIIIFGFIARDKGYDLLIEAFAECIANLPSSARLIIAGSVRTKQQEVYAASCHSRARALGIDKQVEWTGFIPESEVHALYRRATLVVAPFRTTTGSGSLAQALAHGSPVLASDLPLNREIVDRVPGSLAFFKTEDPTSCAEEIMRLLNSPLELAQLSNNALRYAAECSPERIAAMHMKFYVHGE
jgi:glycosyltransferase involved in cell wall biosynthesis